MKALCPRPLVEWGAMELEEVSSPWLVASQTSRIPGLRTLTHKHASYWTFQYDYRFWLKTISFFSKNAGSGPGRPGLPDAICNEVGYQHGVPSPIFICKEENTLLYGTITRALGATKAFKERPRCARSGLYGHNVWVWNPGSATYHLCKLGQGRL